MPARPLTTLSQSSLQDYADCPRRFKLRYLDGLNYPAVESEPALENEKSLEDGRIFHHLVQRALLGMDPARLGRYAGTEDLRRWWQNWLHHKPNLDDWLIFPEFSLTAPLGDLRLVAKYDLIALRDGQALIFDWKTSRRRPPNKKLVVRWQTRVYMALLAQSGGSLNGGKLIPPEKIHMTYWFPDFPKEPAVFTYTSSRFKRDWDILLKIAEEIPSAVDYPMTDDLQKCSTCVFRSYCNRGRAAGKDPEAGAETSPGKPFDVNFEQIGEIAF